ncbi:chorismate-binding protein, partial [candidate division KSB1 bacterium]|nr:chorismate-binding protein [candidate division KSB1 bacterium]
RFCKFGSIAVAEFMVIEKYSHVMHIVSEVTGRLAPNKDSFDVLFGSFPAGTVTGAPKIRAMEIIDDLEETRRGVYAGAVGYIDFQNNMDTCIAIRTLVAKNNTVFIQAGAGIVADSIPENEYNETMLKAGALLNAIAAAEGKSYDFSD